MILINLDLFYLHFVVVLVRSFVCSIVCTLELILCFFFVNYFRRCLVNFKRGKKIFLEQKDIFGPSTRVWIIVGWRFTVIDGNCHFFVTETFINTFEYFPTYINRIQRIHMDMDVYVSWCWIPFLFTI